VAGAAGSMGGAVQPQEQQAGRHQEGGSKAKAEMLQAAQAVCAAQCSAAGRWWSQVRPARNGMCGVVCVQLCV